MSATPLYRISFYVPSDHCEALKQALFAVGAGRFGNYDCCSWQCRGEGQFRPLTGSNPTLGSIDTLQKVVEYRVEMVCQRQYLQAAVEALLHHHPYEQPAYAVTALVDVGTLD